MTPLYLDHAASTPLAPEVADAMEPWLRGQFGNPHSDHLTGTAAAKAVEHAKDQISSLLACAPADIVFTSGATEANNLALKGVLQSEKIAGRHLIVSAIEHKCVLEAARYLEHIGYDLTVVLPASNGRVSASDVADVMRDDTALVSVMAVNMQGPSEPDGLDIGQEPVAVPPPVSPDPLARVASLRPQAVGLGHSHDDRKHGHRPIRRHWRRVQGGEPVPHVPRRDTGNLPARNQGRICLPR